MAQAGGIPPEGKQKAGEEAITLARKALEIHTQLYRTESNRVAADMRVLADVLDYFNDVDDDEVLRLYEQSKAIYRRVECSSSLNVAVGENNLGSAYRTRADRAHAANDLDRCMANLELALTHLREAVRIYMAINHVDKAAESLRHVARIEENIRKIRIARCGSNSDQEMSKCELYAVVERALALLDEMNELFEEGERRNSILLVCPSLHPGQ